MFARQKRQGWDNFNGPINEARAASTAGGGTALTNAATLIGFPKGTSHAEIIARNFATAVVVKWALNPFMAIYVTADGGRNFTDSSDAGQQNPAVASSISLSSLATLGNGGAVMLGSVVPWRGIKVVMSGSVNAVASVMLGEFWNGTAWATLSVTDGTAAAGATFGQSGDVTWTVPTTWVADNLPNTLTQGLKQFTPPLPPSQYRAYSEAAPFKLFWARFTVSAALTAATAANSMFSYNRSTAYAEMLENSLEAFRVQKSLGGVACAELLTDAGTANAVVNVYTDSPTAQF